MQAKQYAIFSSQRFCERGGVFFSSAVVVGDGNAPIVEWGGPRGMDTLFDWRRRRLVSKE